MIRGQKVFWTDHAKIKMRQYGLSKSKLMQILTNPERQEEGIVPGTIAVMQTKKVYPSRVAVTVKPGLAKKPAGEIWLMYTKLKKPVVAIKIISAWRYPGISKPNERIPIPEDIRQELVTYQHAEF